VVHAFTVDHGDPCSEAPTAGTGRASSEVTQDANQGHNVENSTALTLAGTIVRQVNGLYSLTDLHKASGAEPKHRPNYFFESDQTQALIGEISKAGIPAFEARRGNNGGTYACKELVIAYAAWISAAFHLKVIRVFLDAVQPAAPAIDYTRISPAQAQDLREIAKAIVDAGIQGHGETWARLQRKFRVNSYLQLPFNRYEEARQYLIAKLPAGYAGEVVDETNKVDVMDFALIESAMKAANTVGIQIQQAAFMAMLKAQTLQSGRWMVSFGYGAEPAVPSIKPISDAAHIGTIPEMVKRIQDPSTIFDSQDLMDLAKACMNRLSTRIGGGGQLELA